MDSEPVGSPAGRGQALRKRAPLYNEYTVAHTSITSGFTRRITATNTANSDPRCNNQDSELNSISSRALPSLELDTPVEGIVSTRPPKIDFGAPSKRNGFDTDLESCLVDSPMPRLLLSGIRKVLGGRKTRNCNDFDESVVISSPFANSFSFSSADCIFRGVNYSDLSSNPYNIPPNFVMPVPKGVVRESVEDAAVQFSAFNRPCNNQRYGLDIRTSEGQIIVPSKVSLHSHRDGYNRPIRANIASSGLAPYRENFSQSSPGYYQVPVLAPQRINAPHSREPNEGQSFYANQSIYTQLGHGRSPDSRRPYRPIRQRGELNLQDLELGPGPDLVNRRNNSRSAAYARIPTQTGFNDPDSSARRPDFGHQSVFPQATDHAGLTMRHESNLPDFEMGPGPDVGPVVLRGPFQAGFNLEHLEMGPGSDLGSGSQNRHLMDQVALKSHQTSSVNDGSTVENIVRQYAREDEFEDDLRSTYEDSIDEGPFALKIPSQSIMDRATALQSKQVQPKQVIRRQPGMPNLGNIMQFPPKTSLPRLPNRRSPPPVAPPGSSVYGTSDSYGDTKKLLDVTQSNNPFWRIMGKPQYASPFTAKDSSPRLGLDWFRNPFLQNQDRENSLERDVSLALRQQSPFTSSQTLEECLRNEPRCKAKKSNRYEIPRKVVEKPQPDGTGAQQKLGFYQKSAIPTIWVDADRVRIPIKRPDSLKSQELQVANVKDDEGGCVEGILQDEDDNGEWETVLGSCIPSRMNSRATGNNPYMHSRAQCNETGSSLADNSSRGDISPVHVGYNHFKVTDKIVAHPAAIHGPHGYRGREKGFGEAPILMPSYGEHYTNGFPQNSARIFTSPYQSPMPMPVAHRNPFLSSPPSNLISRGYQEEIPRFSDAVDSPVNYSRWKGKDVDTHCHPAYRVTATKKGLVDEAVTTPTYPKATYCRPYLSDEECEKLMNGGALESVHGRRKKSYRKNKATYILHTPAIELSTMKRNVTTKRQRPGAFYQKIRSQSDNQSRILNRQETQIRPEVLRSGPPPADPLNSDGTPPRSFIKNAEFTFRSPLAPVRNPEWQALYTPEQLADITFKAYLRGVDDSGMYDAFELGQSNNNRRTGFSNSTVVLNHEPRLQNLDRRPDECYEKQETFISGCCLGLSSLFPPLLYMYWASQFDIVMGWATRNQITKMKISHKTAAFWMAPILVLFIITIIAIIVGVKIHNNAGTRTHH